MALTKMIKNLFGMKLNDENDNNLLFMLLFLILSDSGADDPETHEWLKYLEPEFERLEPEFERMLERKFSFIKLPFIPHYLFRGMMRRVAQRKTYINGSAIADMQSRLREHEVELSSIHNNLGHINIDKELSDAKVLMSNLESKLAELTWEISTGINLSEMKIHRSIPVRVYLFH